MAAAGPNAQSISWAASATLGRMCGSIWASAVLPALLEEPTSRLTTEDVEKILPENAKEEQRKILSFFCRSVFEYLFRKVDRKAAEHDSEMMNGACYEPTGPGFFQPTIANVTIN